MLRTLKKKTGGETPPLQKREALKSLPRKSEGGFCKANSDEVERDFELTPHIRVDEGHRPLQLSPIRRVRCPHRTVKSEVSGQWKIENETIPHRL